MTTDTATTVHPLAAELLRARLGEKIIELEEKPDMPLARVKRAHLQEVVATLKADPALQFDYLRVIAGVDYGEEFEVVYLFLSLTHKHAAGLKVRVPRTEPKLASLTDFYTTADWQEREIFDLFGIVFTGHRDLHRILLPDWWEGHPLRKDYESAVDLRHGGAGDPAAELPGYVPPMEWLKNRKSAANFGAMQSPAPTPSIESQPTPANGVQVTETAPADSTEDRVARARAKAAAIRAQREAQAAQVTPPVEPPERTAPVMARPDYATMTIDEINAITDRVKRSRAKAVWRKAHPE